jgi:S-methylmethionine-dependent homocysteine/selenocysteine methylase
MIFSMPNPDLTILDGGTGRELKRMGAPFRQPEWSALALMEAPDFVSRVHRAYIEAGADVITSNSYAVVPFHIGLERFASDGARLATLAGRLAREEADRTGGRVRVAASLPPVCGSYMADSFDREAARPLLRTLVDSLAPFADLWLAETMSCVAEAELVRETLGNDPRPLWLSFTLEDYAPVPGQPRLRSAETAQDAIAAASRLGAAALLFNCSQPEVMGDAVAAAKAALGTVPIGVYANAFTAQLPEGHANERITPMRDDITPESYLAFARQWVAQGARIIGGCCGVGPEHIRLLRQALASGH